MNLEVERCSCCGKSLRDSDPLEKDYPVTLKRGQKLCSYCYQDMVDQLSR